MNKLEGSLLVLAGAACFGCSGTLAALAPEGATPYVVGGTRMLMSALTLFAVLLITTRHLPVLKGMPLKSYLIVTFAMWLYQVTFFQGLVLTGVAVGTVVSIGTTPIASGIIVWVLDKKAPGKIWLFATLIAVAGVVLLNYTPGVEINPAGVLLPLTAGICYAFEIYYSADMIKKVNPMAATMAVHLLAGICLVPFFFFYPFAWVLTPDGMLSVFLLGAVSAALPFSLMFWGMKVTPPAIASTLSLAEPMTAACLGIFLLGEPCKATTVVGIAAIFVSVLIIVFFESRGEKAKA